MSRTNQVGVVSVMKTSHCVCGNPVYFHNSFCRHCDRTLGFLPDQLQICAIEADGSDLFRVLAPMATESLYRQCQNYSFEQVCNWLVEQNDESPYCRACRLNHTIPDLSIADNRVRWYRIEEAKRRLLYTLYRLGLPVVGRDRNPDTGLSFAFLADPSAGQKVYTGHDDGLITINVAEADDSQREYIRENLGERYRTLLGHFRHEIGHYYWDQLIDGTPWLPEFREMFGDERANYDECMTRHYQQGAPADWQNRFVSAYASMHPWEDWAESWAHYLHITDTLETAADFDLTLLAKPVLMPPLLLDTTAPANAERPAFDRQVTDWADMALCINAINRSLGLPDPYPFVLSQSIHDKLFFIHRVVAFAAVEKSVDSVPEKKQLNAMHIS
jgi:hypothetical protein